MLRKIARFILRAEIEWAERETAWAVGHLQSLVAQRDDIIKKLDDEIRIRDEFILKVMEDPLQPGQTEWSSDLHIDGASGNPAR